MDLTGSFFRRLLRPAAENAGELPKRRIAELPAKTYFPAVKLQVVMVLSCPNREVRRIIGLDNHFALLLPPSASARNLGQELKSALRGADVRKVQGEDPH